MAFKKIEPNVFKFSDKEKELVGKLLKVEDSKKYKSKVYHIETDEGKHLVVFGTAVLDDRMSFVKVEDNVKIVYKGTEENKKGQDTKIFEVYVDDLED